MSLRTSPQTGVAIFSIDSVNLREDCHATPSILYLLAFIVARNDSRLYSTSQ